MRVVEECILIAVKPVRCSFRFNGLPDAPAPSSLQKIRLSSDGANQLNGSRNWQADGDGSSVCTLIRAASTFIVVARAPHSSQTLMVFNVSSSSSMLPQALPLLPLDGWRYEAFIGRPDGQGGHRVLQAAGFSTEATVDRELEAALAHIRELEEENAQLVRYRDLSDAVVRKLGCKDSAEARAQKPGNFGLLRPYVAPKFHTNEGHIRVRLTCLGPLGFGVFAASAGHSRGFFVTGLAFRQA